MTRKMEPVEVGISEGGCIRIEQEDGSGDGAVIVIHPSQLDVLIQWLKETREEIEHAEKHAVPAER